MSTLWNSIFVSTKRGSSSRDHATKGEEASASGMLMGGVCGTADTGTETPLIETENSEADAQADAQTDAMLCVRV